jgi:hypothetical protein
MADTLLSIVQDILAEMDGDNVNSISDTIEATSVATIVRSVFKDMVEEHEIPGRCDLISLTGLGDTDKPTHMMIPDNVQRISWIKYDRRLESGADKAYGDVYFKEPYEFVGLCNSRPSTDTTNYQVVAYSANTPIIIGKLAHPTWWTTFDDKYLVFDSFNSDVDATLQASKVMTQAYIRPVLTLSDTAIPEIPENLMRNLYHQSLSRCLIDLKTVVNPKAERNENRFRVRSQRNKWRSRKHKEDTHNWGR